MKSEKPINDILETKGLSESPFKVPEGYLEKLEAYVSERIESESSQRGFWKVAKPAIALACSFALVLGMGYGILALTGSLEKEQEQIAGISVLDSGYLHTSFIDHYEVPEAETEETLDNEEILDYLSSSMTTSEISDIYAQLK